MQTIHLICNAHLDPVWKWDWEEGLTEALSTFEVAADLLEKVPDYIFNHNESVLYEWTLEYRPDLFERIQRLVKAGRWHIAGGWYLQPDCNLPDGESFVRQILVGREFFKKHFGVTPKVAYNFDAFGHHGNLPQILKKSGYRAYIHFRPAPNDLDLPADLYRWRGIDKSEVLSYRPPFTWYGTDDFHELKRRIEQTMAEQRKAATPVGIFWGMGDHGGGATRADLAQIVEMQSQCPVLEHSTTDRLLESFEMSGMELPVHVGDLQRVFPGCYTSVSQIKRANRRAESLAQQAERLATLAWWFAGASYPREKMLALWKDTLFNQFHDILPGSSTRKAMDGALEIVGRQHKNAREMILQSQLALSRSVRPREPLCLLVFNPHPYAQKVPVDFEYMVGHRPIIDRRVVTRVTNTQGRSLLSQEEMPGAVTTCFDWRKRAVFEAELPALGYAEFQIHLDTAGGEKPRPGVAWEQGEGEWLFSTPQLKFALDPRTGLVTRLESGKGGTAEPVNLLARPGGELRVVRDDSDSWGTDVTDYDVVAGHFQLAAAEEVPAITGQLHRGCLDPVRVIEEGAIRTIVEVISVYGRSTATVRYTIYADRPEIEIDLRVVWNEPRHLLKLIWPTIHDESHYHVEIPYGDIERKQGSGEQANGRWIMLSQRGGKGDAFTLLTQGPGGHDVERGELRLSLLRSAIYCHSHLHPLREAIAHDLMDTGESRFKMALVALPAKAVRARLLRLTERISLPVSHLIHYPLSASPVSGIEAGTRMIEIEGSGVELGAIKPSEQGDSLIVRLVERGGRSTVAFLSIGTCVEQYPVNFEPYEIVTLRLDRDGSIREVDLMEQELPMKRTWDEELDQR